MTAGNEHQSLIHAIQCQGTDPGTPHATGGPKAVDTWSNTLQAEPQATLIPKLIHQTYKSSNVPSAVVPLMQSWRRLNPDWDVRFYNDAGCLEFVRREFPEYLDAYQALPKDVERSDFFRWARLVMNESDRS